MKVGRILFLAFLVLTLVSGCSTVKWNDWKVCAAAGAVVGATAGGFAAGDAGYGIAGGGIGGALLGGLLCHLLAESDSDGDGVGDDKDQCPNTPRGVEVDEVGCPLDDDGDGVPNYLDKCPNTPRGAKVDENGCPLDSDGDGVLDYKDQCPDTPRGVAVDAVGCPLDSDGDGVPDYKDQCPGTPMGTPVDENGCPLVSKIIQQIHFDLDSARIRNDEEATLDQVAIILQQNPTQRVMIEGHTCDLGTDDYNQKLSERRAESVFKYLITRDPSLSSRLETVGMGESQLIPGATREMDRRIEFKVLQ